MTAAVQTEIWQSTWDAESLMRYYESLHRRLHRWHTAGSFVLGIAGTGAAVAFVARLPEQVQVLAGLVLAVATVAMFVSGLAAKAAVAHAISVQCAELALEFKTLYLDVRSHALADDAATAEWRKLVERLTNATSKAGAAGLASNDKLVAKSYETAREVMDLAHAA